MTRTTIRRYWRLSQESRFISTIQYLIFMGLMVWFVVQGADKMGYQWQWYKIPGHFYKVFEGEIYPGRLARGLWVTLELTFWCVGFTLLVGLVTALLRMSSSVSGRLLATAYLELVRNTPLLVQLYLFYFVFSPILGIDRFWTGVICLTFYEGSFVAEIIRSGINSVERGQWEAGDSVGLTRRSIYRYIIIPQSIPLMLPPLTGQIINLIKHSAIVSVIAVADLTTEGRNIIADTFMSFEIWFTIAGVYLCITLTLSVFVSWLERKAEVRT